MSITDQLLAAFLLNGLPMLFGVTVVASIGVPIPARLMLLAAGSFVEQGEMQLMPVIVVAAVAAVVGDQIGFGLARWGGRRVLTRLSRRLGMEARFKEVQGLAARWGDAGVFLSRWLVTELGSLVNVTTGVAAYPWRRFIFWDVLGELLWVILYVTLGYFFSDRIQILTGIMSDLAWTILGLIATLALGWKVLRYFRPAAPKSDEKAA